MYDVTRTPPIIQSLIPYTGIVAVSYSIQHKYRDIHLLCLRLQDKNIKNKKVAVEMTLLSEVAEVVCGPLGKLRVLMNLLWLYTNRRNGATRNNTNPALRDITDHATFS